MRCLLQGFGLLLLPASLSFGALQLQTTTTLHGQGYGNVATILSFKGNQGPALEGCVGRTGGVDVEGASLSGNSCNGLTPATLDSNKTQTVAFNDPALLLGSTELSSLALVYNSNQTGNSPNITLYDIVLTVYSPTGTPLWWSAGVLGPAPSNNSVPLELNPISQGIGGAKFIFKLDVAQQAAFEAAAGGGNYNANNRFGLYARTGCAGSQGPTCRENNDGGETFSLTKVTPIPDDELVPEPSTWLMMSGALAVAAYRKFASSKV